MSGLWKPGQPAATREDAVETERVLLNFSNQPQPHGTGPGTRKRASRPRVTRRRLALPSPCRFRGVQRKSRLRPGWGGYNSVASGFLTRPDPLSSMISRGRDGSGAGSLHIDLSFFGFLSAALFLASRTAVWRAVRRLCRRYSTRAPRTSSGKEAGVSLRISPLSVFCPSSHLPCPKIIVFQGASTSVNSV